MEDEAVGSVVWKETRKQINCSTQEGERRRTWNSTVESWNFKNKTKSGLWEIPSGRKRKTFKNRNIQHLTLNKSYCNTVLLQGPKLSGKISYAQSLMSFFRGENEFQQFQFWFTGFANFCGVNTPTMADFELPMWEQQSFKTPQNF